MPNKTFYKISSEKRNRILESGKAVFSNCVFENVDVKMIVEACDIPRGSFYAYFSDIEDYYATVIESLQNNRIKIVKSIQEENVLNFFSFISKVFEHDIKVSLYSDQSLLIQHYFRYVLTHKLGYHNNDKALKRPIFSLLDIYQDEFNMNLEAWSDFLELTMNIYLMTYLKAIKENYDFEQSINLFQNRIKLLKKGVE